MQRKHVLALGLAAAATVSIAAFAQKGTLLRDELVRGRSADLVATPKQRLLSQRASTVAKPAARRVPVMARLADPLYPVTEDEVYDVDSFGRNVRWLGLASAFINVQSGCPKPTTPDEFCQELNATPGASTAFTFNDAARIKLPKYASNSLLCYWFSPVLNVTYSNVTASRVIGRFRYSPTLTIESPVLADPALIDPTTGVPFGGQLLTSMTSSESFQESLEPGVTLSERSRDSTVCMGRFHQPQVLDPELRTDPGAGGRFLRQPDHRSPQRERQRAARQQRLDGVRPARRRRLTHRTVRPVARVAPDERWPACACTRVQIGYLPTSGAPFMSRKTLLSLGIAAAAFASIAVFAQQGGLSRDDIVEAVSPDLPTGRAAAAAHPEPAGHGCRARFRAEGRRPRTGRAHCRGCV